MPRAVGGKPRFGKGLPIRASYVAAVSRCLKLTEELLQRGGFDSPCCSPVEAVFGKGSNHLGRLVLLSFSKFSSCRCLLQFSQIGDQCYLAHQSKNEGAPASKVLRETHPREPRIHRRRGISCG